MQLTPRGPTVTTVTFVKGCLGVCVQVTTGKQDVWTGSVHKCEASISQSAFRLSRT